MKKITLLIALFASFIFEANGQAVNTYGFAASTGGTLDAMTGSTQLIGTGSDDGASPVTNIGFTFNYAGTNYTQFSANANGLVRLGATAVTTQYTNSAANANTATPVIMPYWDDLATGSAAGGGKVHYLLTGSAPNQRLIIEWFVTIPRNTTGAANARFQCILEETTNKIYFVYGNGMVADTSNSGASIGLATATAVYNTVTASTNTNTTSTFVTNNTAGLAVGTVYTWTPPAPCAGTPVAGAIAPALQNVCAGTTPASFAATGFSMGVTGITFQWEESNDDGVTDAWAPAVGGTGATTASYTPPAFSGTTIYYRLNVTCTNSALSAQTASVSVNPPTAPLTQASALNFTNTLYTSVTANWTNGNGSRRILVVSDNPAIVDPVNASGQPAITANSMYAGSGQQIVYDGTGTTANVYGLGCNATYYFKVFDYTRCGAGPYDFYYNVTSGTNAASVTTTTPASATLPVANNFTGFTGANLSTVFPGWYEGAIPTAALAVPSNSNPGNNASNWFNSSALGVTTAKINLYTNTRNEWIISPKIALTGNSRMLYRAAITDFSNGNADPVKMAGTDDKVQIMISTDGCGANWTPIFTFDASNTAALTNVLTDYTLDLTAYTGQTVQIAFRGTDGPVDDTADYDFHITNINIELIPSCSTPTALGANNITANAASLFWTAGATEAAWNIEWGPTGFAQGTGTVVNGVTNPHPLSGLTASTTFQYYVQADCTTNGTSTWAGPFSFTTSCIAASVPYTQDFESATVPNLPSCTSQVNAGTGNLWTVESNPGYGFTTKALRYKWNTTNAANVWFFTQGVNLTAGQQYKISYNYGNAGATFPEKLKVAYGTSNTPAAMVTTLADYTNINQATIQNDLIVFTPATDGVYYFGFQAYSAADQFYLLVDNIVVDVNLGTSAFDSSSFKAYPNPVTNVLNLSYSSEIASVEVFNMLGQKVMVKELNVAQGQIDMSGLNSGNYLVKVTADGQTKTIKVIKQ